MSLVAGPTNNTILIMTGSDRTCTQLREYLSSMEGSILSGVTKGAGIGGDDEENSDSNPGRKLMERYLRNYFFWKSGLGQTSANIFNSRNGNDALHSYSAKNSASTSGNVMNSTGGRVGVENEALKRKAEFNKSRGSQKRRRQRGGAGAGGPGRAGKDAGPAEAEKEAEEVADL